MGQGKIGRRVGRVNIVEGGMFENGVEGKGVREMSKGKC